MSGLFQIGNSETEACVEDHRALQHKICGWRFQGDNSVKLPFEGRQERPKRINILKHTNFGLQNRGGGSRRKLRLRVRAQGGHAETPLSVTQNLLDLWVTHRENPQGERGGIAVHSGQESVQTRLSCWTRTQTTLRIHTDWHKTLPFPWLEPNKGMFPDVVVESASSRAKHFFFWKLSSPHPDADNTTFKIENVNLKICFAYLTSSTFWKCFCLCKNIVELNWPRTRVSQSEIFCARGFEVEATMKFPLQTSLFELPVVIVLCGW